MKSPRIGIDPFAVEAYENWLDGNDFPEGTIVTVRDGDTAHTGIVTDSRIDRVTGVQTLVLDDNGPLARAEEIVTVLVRQAAVITHG